MSVKLAPGDKLFVYESAPVTREVAERRRKRLLKRRAERMPLFEHAGIADEVAPVPDADEIEAQLRATSQAYRAGLRDFGEQTAQLSYECRQQVAALVSEECLARLDARRQRVYSAEPTHGADFWGGVLAKLRLARAPKWRGPAYRVERGYEYPDWAHAADVVRREVQGGTEIEFAEVIDRELVRVAARAVMWVARGGPESAAVDLEGGVILAEDGGHYLVLRALRTAREGAA